MSGTDERRELGARYVAELQDATRRLPRIRDAGARSRMRAALRRAIAGTLRYSDDKAAIDMALAALRNLETGRHFTALNEHATALRRRGARIDPSAVTAAAGDLANASTGTILAELATDVAGERIAAIQEARERLGHTTQQETPHA